MRGLLALVLVAAAVPSAADPPSASLLEPGNYHEGEVGDEAAGAWWALCHEHGRASLRAVTVQVKQVHDELRDEAHGEKSGRRVIVHGCRHAVLLVRGLPMLAARAVQAAKLAKLPPPAPTSRRTIDRYTVDWKGAAFTLAELDSACGYRLRLEGPDVAQDIYAAELPTGRCGPDGGALDEWVHWQLRWAGDLDGDGRLDLLIDASDPQNPGNLRLFLSGGATGGDAVHQVVSSRGS
jgi:hypothetical protein